MTFTLKGTIIEDPTAGPLPRVTESDPSPTVDTETQGAWECATLEAAQSEYDTVRTMFWELGLLLINAVIVDSDGNTYPVEVDV